MTLGRVMLTISLACACAGWAQAQEAAPPPAAKPAPAAEPVRAQKIPETPKPLTTETIALTVAKGTPIQVALDKDVRVRKAGQSIHGRVVEPVYAFDKLVLPAGTEVTGQITKIEKISGGKRTLSVLDADFTPARKIQVEFTELVLADGKHISIRSSVTPGSGEVLEFVTAPEGKEKNRVKDAATEKAKQAKAEAKRDWDRAMQQLKEPGKMHRLERYAIGQLPARPQYLDAGSVFFAELEEPLDFGIEPLTPELASSLHTAPPDGSVVRARLVTPLNSATTQKGDPVEAILTHPLFDGGRLILPQGTRLKGSVVQVRPARHMGRNGQLRFVFHDLVLPDGIETRVNAILEGVESAKADNVKLDSEGSAETRSPKTRYLSTALAVTLAATSHGDDDALNRTSGGAGGFKLIGMALGMAVRSQPLGMAMGAYGASRSIYSHFIGRGRDIVFPRNTAMEIGVGTRRTTAPAPGVVPTPDRTPKQ
jgi:type IV secretory pathway VirB10-like protein